MSVLILLNQNMALSLRIYSKVTGSSGKGRVREIGPDSLRGRYVD